MVDPSAQRSNIPATVIKKITKSVSYTGFLLLLIHFAGHAQTGPAGVGNATGSGGQAENVLWLDAGKLPLANNDPVLVWPDQSGNGLDLGRLGSDNIPFFRNDGLASGNHPVVRFDGTERYLKLADNDRLDADLAGLTIIMVARSATLDGRPRGLLSKRNSSSAQESYSVFTYSGDNLFFDVHNGNDNRLRASEALNTATDYIHSLTFDGSTQYAYAQSVGTGSRNVSGSGNLSNTTSDLILGALNENYNRYFDGDLAEVILYRGALSEADRLIVENYLSQKYNITSRYDLLGNSPDYAADYTYDIRGIGSDGTSVRTDAFNSGGLSLRERASSLGADEYVMLAHNDAPHADNMTTQLADATHITDRWARDWYVEVNRGGGAAGVDEANVSVALVFDFSASSSLTYSGSASDYVLLYRSTATGSFDRVYAESYTAEGANRIVVNVPAAQLKTGYYTLGTGIPLLARTWYSYQNGDWNDFNTWTLDGASLPDFENPGSEVPGPNDNVVITAGNTVTIATDGQVVASAAVVGALDVTTSTSHDLGVITGNGTILMQGDGSGSDNFPAGDASHFVDATDGGTVVLYGDGLSLDAPRTFNHLRVALDGSNDKAVLLKNYIVNGDLTVVAGTLQINDNVATANLTVDVYGDVVVNGNGLISTGRSNVRHQLNLYGDLINNGNVAFTNRTNPDYDAEATDGVVDINFLNDAQDQALICNGSSRFYRIEIDKGVSQTYELFMTANNPDNFKLLGFANQGHPQSAQLITNSNALGLLRGTVRIGSNVSIPHLNGGGNYNISENARLWVDGGLVRKENGTAIVVYGTAQVSAGILDAPINSGFTLRENGTIKVEETGVLNANQIRTSVLGAGSLGGYIQTGGTANLLGNNTNGDYYVFNLTHPGNVFTMKGGELNIRESRGKGGMFINSNPENIDVTEGTVNLEIGNNRDMVITSRAPFYNLNMRNTAGNNRRIVLDQGVDVSSTQTDLAAQPLVVLNDLTIEENTHFKTNGQNVTVGRNFTIEDNALYEFEDNTTIFNSGRDGTLYVGDITGLTNGSYTDPEGSNTYASWEQPFYNLTVDKPGATLTLATACTYTTTDNVYHNGSSCKNIRGWRNNLVKVARDFALEAGTVDLDKYSIRLYGNVTNRGVFGVDYEPRNAQVKFRKEDTPVNRTITTEDGAEFGNLRFNSGEAVLSITSDVYVQRLDYRHGRFNIGSHNLRVDQLDIGLEDLADFDYNQDGDTDDAGEKQVFSPADMIITAGNASDGGVSLYIDGDGSYPLPLGVGTGATRLAANGAKYTPATVTVSNFADDGYITVNPVDKTLLTTDPTGGDVLSYYWAVDHRDFSTLPTVQYEFTYDESDVDGAATESTFVPGSVMAANPFTRSYEDESIPEQEAVDAVNNTITFHGASDSGFTPEKANYTAGEYPRFIGAPRVFYSRISSSDDNNEPWDATNRDLWTFNETGPNARVAGSDLPITFGDIVVVRDGHVIQLDGSKVEAAELILDATNGASGIIFEDASTGGSIQDVAYTSAFGRVVATATAPTVHTPFIQFYVDQVWTKARIDNEEFVLPQSDYGDFLDFTNSNGGLADVIFTYDESSQHGAPAYLPDDILEFPNLRFGLEVPKNSPNADYTIVLPEVDINVRGTLSVEGGVVLHVNNGSQGDIAANVIEFLSPSQLQFPGNSTTARTVTVDSLLQFSASNHNQLLDIFAANTGTLAHTLQVNGDINMNGGDLNLYGGDPATHTNVILRLGGNTNTAFNRTAGLVPDLYRLEVDKTYVDSSVVVNTNFRLHGPTDGSTKALALRQGTLGLNSSTIDIDLSTGGDNFVIPTTATLEVRGGTVNVSGDDTGMLLAGTLRLSGPNAVVDMNNAGNGNNYIEYSVGNPTLEVLDGTLRVGSQIRRVLNDDSGVLDYVQTGGSVTVGRKANGIATRGMLEVVNGGAFVHTGGELKIVRANGSATVASLLLAPGSFDTNGSTITLGDGQSPFNQNYGINTSVPLGNLIVNNVNALGSSRNPTASIFVQPLTVDGTLTITDGATLDAGSADGTGLTLTLNGDLVNDGTYVPNNNTTVFSSNTTQTISGISTTEFYNLDKTNSGTLTLNQQSILVTHDLRMLNGTVADHGNTIEVRGNVTHDAVHTSSGGEGLLLAGTNQQQLQRNAAGTSTLGVMTIRNASGVVVPESNGFNFTVTERLRLDQGIFNTGSSLLTVAANATIEAVNPYGATNMIKTNSSFSDPGVKKVFPAGHTTNFIFPVGEDVYSPVTIDFASAGGSIGPNQAEITVVPNRRYHPVVDDGIDNTLPTDLNNVLQYYWAVRTAGLTDFTANIWFDYDLSDVALGVDNSSDPYLESEYVPARVLTLGGNTSVDKFSPTLVDETTHRITFEFVNGNDRAVYGDYFAGIDSAIPDDIPVFTSVQDGDYNDPATWSVDPATTPFPVGGPQGSSIIVVASGHRVSFNRSGIKIYKTTINPGATVDLNTSTGHNLGIVSGSGIIETQTGVLPAGLYKDFFTCTGGEINYSGTGDYGVFKGNISRMRKVTFSGEGTRTLPNKSSIQICEDVVMDESVSPGGPTLINPTGGTRIVDVGGSFLIRKGTFRTGDNTLTVEGKLVVQGSYTGENNHRSTVDGDVEITGGTFNAGNNSVISVGGNISYTGGAFTSGTSRIVMRGNSAQTIFGDFTGAADMNRLEINNSAGVTLGGAMDIDTELVLRAGTLTPGANKLRLDADATVGPDAEGSATSFVNGTLCKIITNSEEFYFPVGKGNRWGYASVDPDPTDTHEWCVEYFNRIATSESTISNTDPSLSALTRIPNPIRTVSENEYWRIADDATGVNARIGLRWDGGSDVSANGNDWDGLEVMKWNGTAWDAHGGTGHYSNPTPTQSLGFFEATTDITFSERFVTLGSTTTNNALPVELLSFKAVAQAESVKLVWETASEINNDYFEVQRSVDGLTFKKVGEVVGKGNTNALQSYWFVDKLPLAGVSYYRLKQVDYDGMYDHSEVVSVEWINEGARASFVELHLYPNPAPRGEAKLRVSGLSPRSTVTVKLLDMFGKVYLQRIVEASQLTNQGYLMRSPVRLASGVYVVSVQQGSTVHQKTLIMR